MADALIQRAEPQNPWDENLDLIPELSTGSSLLEKRIEFHKARKPYNGLNSGGGDFRLETLNPGSSGSDSCKVVPSNQAQASLSAKKMDGSEYLEHGLDPELSFGITVRRIGAGLRNMGNTCYLNSVLQCLTYTEPLAAYLQSGKHRNSCHVAGFCALCAIQKHVSLALQSTGRILVPKDLVINLRCISRNFTKSRQEDAHEYMVNLLESMHKCCLPSGVPSESPSAYEKSLVHKIFGGRLRSQVKCLQCSYCSNKFDPFLDLSLEIFKADSLQKALVNFTAAEQLDGGERQYHCQRCKQKVMALKQMTVNKPPYVLSIHLKRFRAHDPGRKIDRHVKFSPTLDLRPYVSDSYEGDLKYTLYGVLVHCGASTYSGHYYCYVRTSSGMWYSLDDNQVFQVSERTVLEQKAYMLFYVRDRRNIIPRKPVEVAQKLNFNANSVSFKIRPTNSQGPKELVQNISVVGRSVGLPPSVVVTQKDASTVGPPEVPGPPKVPSPPVVTGPQEAPLLKKASVVTAEKVPLSKDLLKGSSIPNSRIGKDMLPVPSSPLPSRNTGTSDSQNSTAAATDVNNKDLNEKGNSIENSGVSAVILPNVKESENFQAANSVTEEASQNNNLISSPGDLGTGTSRVPGGIKVAGIHNENLSNQLSSKVSQVGSSTNESAAGSLLVEQTSDCSQKVISDESVKLSGSSVVTNGSLHVKPSDSKRHKKLKKKQMKSRVACTHLRPTLLSRAVLRVQKKKKHKRSKHLTSDTKSHSKEHFSDQGPSTSEKTQSISAVSTLSKRKSKRKRTKSDLKNDLDGTVENSAMGSHSDPLLAVKNGELRESISQKGTMLTTDKCLQNGYGSSSWSIGNQQVIGGTDSLQNYKRGTIQNGSMGVLTEGLDETVVARWDGIELPSQIVESSRAQSLSIGYIPDEWDEEYDRGKRKKVRQPKDTFGGPNPFQAISSQRLQLKKAKVQRFNSGNHPLRI